MLSYKEYAKLSQTLCECSGWSWGSDMWLSYMSSQAFRTWFIKSYL